MKNTWQKELKWELDKQTAAIIEALKAEGFEIKGYKEYVSKLKILLEKDEIEFGIEITQLGKIDIERYVNNVVRNFNIMREREELKKQLAMRNGVSE